MAVKTIRLGPKGMKAIARQEWFNAKLIEAQCFARTDGFHLKPKGSISEEDLRDFCHRNNLMLLVVGPRENPYTTGPEGELPEAKKIREFKSKGYKGPTYYLITRYRVVKKAA